MKPLIEVENVGKSYRIGDTSVPVLEHISFTVNAGESIAIVGPSGSGKSTLLAMMAGIDSVSNGVIRVGGHLITGLTESQLAAVRARLMGFVFQSYRLIPSLTALENVMLPLELLKTQNPEAQAIIALESIGLGNRLNHYPSQLSGGEQQRVAIARAIVHGPQVIFADEPTGNLDSTTGEKVRTLLFKKAKETQSALVLVTHDPAIAARSDRQIRIQDGRLADH